MSDVSLAGRSTSGNDINSRRYGFVLIDSWLNDVLVD